MVFKTQKIRPREIREKAGKRPGSQHGKKQKKKKQLQNASSIVPDQPRPTTIIGVGIELFRGVISSLIGRWREASKCSGIIRRVLYMSCLSIASRRVVVSSVRSSSPEADLSVGIGRLQAHREPFPLLWASHHARRHARWSLLSGARTSNTAALGNHGSLH